MKVVRPSDPSATADNSAAASGWRQQANTRQPARGVLAGELQAQAAVRAGDEDARHDNLPFRTRLPLAYSFVKVNICVIAIKSAYSARQRRR